MSSYSKIILDVGVISSKENWCFDAELAIIKKVALEKFIMCKYFATNQIGILLEPLLIYLYWIFFFGFV